MENLVAVIGFCGLVVIIIVLLTYVLVTKRKKATQLYKEAAAAESEGNYIQAIRLYEQYLKQNSDESDQIGERVKTLKTLTS